MNLDKKDDLNVTAEIIEDEDDKSTSRRSTRSSSKVGTEFLNFTRFSCIQFALPVINVC